PCDVNAIARAVASDAAGRDGGANGARAVVATHLAPAVPPVLGDPVALRRILENLLVNALESLDDGGGRVLVARRVGRGGDGARAGVRVGGAGRGLAEAPRARSCGECCSTKGRGTRCGLWIVRRLVNALGGRREGERGGGQATPFRVAPPAA